MEYYLGYGVDWSSPNLAQLMAIDALAGGRADADALAQAEGDRSEGIANAIMGTVGEFLSWCRLQGWVPPALVNALSQPKYLRYLPGGFDTGEDGQNRTVMVRTSKFRVAVPGYEGLSDEGIGVLLGLARP
ncbi:hypothetical protein [Nonomuraea guangzhouensis]|uniref:Uncharacterized protein n=1 Tax=Nonomuraea guangzhouensis TaxID=1291555 RepID=A0ABW4G7J9_9ACTN|nr:hypothetical protein [Nonomuraea guangzhouensis]